jgi:hypothetical protein
MAGGKEALFPGLGSVAIAHNELAASARFAAFDGPARDFPGHRSPPGWKFVYRPRKKNLRALLPARGKISGSVAG